MSASMMIMMIYRTHQTEAYENVCVRVCVCVCVCVCVSCQGWGVTGLWRLESSFPESFSWWLHWQLKLVTRQMGKHTRTNTHTHAPTHTHIHRRARKRPPTHTHVPTHVPSSAQPSVHSDTHRIWDDCGHLTSYCTQPCLNTHTHTLYCFTCEDTH